MKKRIKKTALFTIVFGLLLLVPSIYFGYLEYSSGTLEKDFVGIILGFVAGLLFLVFGFIWFFRHRKSGDTITQLKRHGKKIHARYLKQEETNHSAHGHTGRIIFLQGEGSNRVFQTKPIFSEFSIKWLEEHVFDIYIDTDNFDNYYIDIEKHFGEPILYK